MISIKVPASTANLGPGFDSLGMALNLYLEVKAELASDWHFVHQGDALKNLPVDDTHFIALKIEEYCQRFKIPFFKLNVQMKSDIPLARGLGSSGTAHIASLLLVNHFGELQLTEKELVNILTEEEGHPDNVVPSLLGGLYAGYYDGEETSYTKLPAIEWPMYAIIPPYELKTQDSRDVLPVQLTLSEAVKASAVSNVLVAALAVKDYETAGSMMMSDCFHEPYRIPLVRDYEVVKKTLGSNGFIFLSGAGPTLLVIVKPSQCHIHQLLQTQLSDCDIREVCIDADGATCVMMDASM